MRGKMRMECLLKDHVSSTNSQISGCISLDPILAPVFFGGPNLV